MPYQYYATTGSGHTPSRSVDEYWEDCSIPWITTADLKYLRDGRQQIVQDTEFKLNEHGIANSAARVHPGGTVVLSRTASVGFAAIMGRPMATSQDFVTWSPGPDIEPRYLLWVLRAMKGIGDFDRLMYGSTHKTIYVPDLQQVRGPLPTIDAQRRIADYLDTETARIDRLIAKNAILAETSRERLHRLVVEATLGLPRESGGEALADAFDCAFAPMHTLALVGTGHTPSRNVAEYWQDCDIPWLNIPDLAQAREFWEDEIAETAEHLNPAGLANSAAVLCPPGTVFVTRTASIGHAVLNSVPMATNQRLVTYRPDPRRLDAGFLLWSIRALKVIGHFDRLTFGATHDTIYYDDMVALRVPVRDLVEQRAAVRAIEELRDEVAVLRERLERSSVLLAERRQALITAAVTGELEV